MNDNDLRLIKESEHYHHLEKIRMELWANKEYGNVAAFIGSGFSKSARKIGDSDKEFPTWSDLAKGLIKELYPSLDENDDTYKRAIVPSEFMKFAHEYKNEFGRDKLHNYISNVIPDLNHEPGELHIDLLKLPWADIFTTNYDTLLERTREHVHYRKYELIQSVQDIPGKPKPRIIKLHGSMPSGNYILTDEDYRTYPNKFSPFINTVQQSLLENIFCLIGFSSEDPNFERWIGWVRDNLGDNQPKIYLFTFDKISVQREGLLKKQNIHSISLQKLVHSARKISEALKILFDFLGKNDDIDQFSWVNNYYFHVPSVSHKKLSNIEVRKLVNNWSNQRKTYPGWIITPYKIRRILYARLCEYRSLSLSQLENLEPEIEIQLIYEFCWIYQTMMMQVFSDDQKRIKEITYKYNPFGKLIDIDGNPAPIYSIESYPKLNWGKH